MEWVGVNLLESVSKVSRMPQGRSISLIIARGGLAIFESCMPLLEGFGDGWDKRGEHRIRYQALMPVDGRKWDDIVAFGKAVALYHASLMDRTLEVRRCFNGLIQVAASWDGRIERPLPIPSRHRCFGPMTLGQGRTQERRLVRRRPPQVARR